MRDEIVEKVQQARQAYGERFGFDLAAIGRDLREQELRSGRIIVNYASDPLELSDGVCLGDEAAPNASSPAYHES